MRGAHDGMNDGMTERWNRWKPTPNQYGETNDGMMELLEPDPEPRATSCSPVIGMVQERR